MAEEHVCGGEGAGGEGVGESAGGGCGAGPSAQLWQDRHPLGNH